MFFSPITYDEPLFRPPAEANSLIFQVTLGCSWNQCAFCEMYTSKQFKVKRTDVVLQEIRHAAKHAFDTRKIFLADGNALMLPMRNLLTILNELRTQFPKLRRVASYASPADLRKKTPDELRTLRYNGLQLIYVGIESGDDDVLRMVNKGETSQSTIDALVKAHNAGLKSSVMIINGLGGKQYSDQHALGSARVANAVQPAFLSTLTLMMPDGLAHFQQRFNGSYEPMNQAELLQEVLTFIQHTQLDRTIYRSNHASNYLPLEGTLSKDKEKLIKTLEYVLQGNDGNALRPEWMRGLQIELLFPICFNGDKIA